MSRKATITQKEIVNAAFKITRKEGFEQITSRKLAAAAGCSTQPIFRIYENMDALKKDKVCGCFYCLRIFSPEEINKWLISKDDSNKCDQYGTAVCPYCGIDSVIGESSGYPITEALI